MTKERIKVIIDAFESEDAALLIYNEIELELKELRARDDLLSHLEENGVDNWEGYSRP